jgi:hypothetical protein
LGQRVRDASEADIDRRFDAGDFVRTHVMRPTWHFVAADDIRWLLALTAARVHQANAYQYGQLDIDGPTAARAAEVFVTTLAGGRSATREELGVALRGAGIEAAGLRLGYLIGHAELETILCNGPRRGKRQTYALFDERVPPSRARERDEALAELATRYVRGHGPAQVIDLSWWSGLTLREARRAFDLAGSALGREEIDGRPFWVDPDEAPPAPSTEGPAVRLLPNYDELLIAFRDRTDAIDPDLPDAARVAEAVLAHIIVRDGLVVGGWKRREGSRSTAIALDLLVALDAAERAALGAAVRSLGNFLGRPIDVTGLD